MKIVPVKVQIKGESQSRVHWALLFPDASQPEDLADYRNALTQCAKSILCDDEKAVQLNDELFYIIQLAEFITTALEDYRNENVAWEQFAKSQLHELATIAMREKEKKGGADEAA